MLRLFGFVIQDQSWIQSWYHIFSLCLWYVMFVIWHLTIWIILDIHETSHQDEAIGPALGGWALCSASVKLIAGIRWVVDVLVLCEATWKGTKRWLFDDDDDDDDDDDYDCLLFDDILYKIPLKRTKKGYASPHTGIVHSWWFRTFMMVPLQPVSIQWLGDQMSYQ